MQGSLVLRDLNEWQSGDIGNSTTLLYVLPYVPIGKFHTTTTTAARQLGSSAARQLGSSAASFLAGSIF